MHPQSKVAILAKAVQQLRARHFGHKTESVIVATAAAGLVSPVREDVKYQATKLPRSHSTVSTRLTWQRPAPLVHSDETTHGQAWRRGVSERSSEGRLTRIVFILYSVLLPFSAFHGAV